MPLTSQTLDQLRSIVGVDRVLWRPGDLEPYARDATPLYRALPDAVVAPGRTEEIAAILRLATAERIPVTPRGAGSNLAAATLAEHGGIVLSMTRMSRIKEVSRTVSTVGGNVATCAGGLRGLKYGVTRNYVLGLEAVLPTGEVIRTGGRLWKDVAGYDITRLLTGSEGTLAVLTEITVGLLPQPQTSRTGVAYFRTLSDAGAAVAAIIDAGILPATLEFLDNRCITAVEDYARLGLDREAGALLLYGDDGEATAVTGTMARMAEACKDTGATGIELAESVAASDDLLAARRCCLPALSRLAPITVLEDVTVPRPRVAEMVSAIEDITGRAGLVCATFGHAGDGNLHPTIVLDPGDTDARDRAGAAFDEIFRTALELGGTITGEHGVGAAKRPWLHQRLGADQMALTRRLKSAFDPAGILNPGKLGS